MILNHISQSFANTETFQGLLSQKSLAETFIEGINPSSYPLIISSLFEKKRGQILVVTDTTQKMQGLALDISSFIDENSIFPLPSWDTLPYEYVSATDRIERDRIRSLYQLLAGQDGIFCTTVEALIRKLPVKDHLLQSGLELEVGEECPFEDLLEMLIQYGYTREMRVESFGQFAVKGGILDIFLPTCDNPIRFDFYGDTCESIRLFDVETQRSITENSPEINCITIYPRKELTLSSGNSQKLLSDLENAKKNVELTDELYSQIDNGVLEDFHGIEDLFSLAIPSANLLSYISDETTVIMLDNEQLLSRARFLEKTFNELFAKKNRKIFSLKPEELIAVSELEAASARALTLQSFTATPDSLHWSMKSLPNFHGRMKSVREEIGNRLEDGFTIAVTTSFEGQARRLYDLLSDFSPDSDFENYSADNPFNIVISPLREGVDCSEDKILLLTDHEIFGKSYRKRKSFKSKHSRPIESFLDLKENDYVVHINHGIGIFRGIERMSAGGVERDFIIVEYAGSDKLYVALDQISLVQKYIGVEGKAPKLNFLGKKSSWNKIKQRVQEAVEEIARELMEIYSQRSSLKGFQFPPDTLWQEEFESKFEYDETPDQISAIEDVKDDMESSEPMDRLICGDVGFGKTEVAIRASFKAVMAGRQVAVLVPTTVLAMQHFSTFKKRFVDYPIEIEMISRFKTQGQIAKIKERLKNGEVDIVIGTHAILAKNMNIKSLALLIIDEEQKFGVRHKEQLKKLKTLVDVLTLSATPIPRTLHMSLSGIRNLSTIATPPENRQAIDTYVMEDNPDILRMAILREIERDGQIFYIHNRVQTIDAQVAMLEKLVPEAAIHAAHGQMHEHELEDVMIDFMKKKYDVLVSTTIIESGLDMPNANTIIINRSDTFGLSQLYQLKGRVGRSNRQAFAYLFYPRHTPLTEEAQKRLQVISEYTELGSGLKIAMKDLEIRGAGNILGKEQSGNIMEVGFELYSQMLDNTFKRLKGEKPSTLFRTPVFLKTDFFIPDEYISDGRQKVEFYKRFESCETPEEVNNICNEMIDRFGLPPAQVSILIEYEMIRTLASSLVIEEILQDSRSIRIKMTEQTEIKPESLINTITKDNRFSLDPDDSQILIFIPDSKDTEKKLQELKKWLQQIS